MAVEPLAARRAAFEDDWARRLSHLVRDANAVTFETAWQTAVTLLQQAVERLGLPPDPQEANRP